MPTIADMLGSAEAYPIWDKRRWNRDARVADAVSMMQKQQELDEVAATKEAERKKALMQTEYGARGANEMSADERLAARLAAEDERRGLVAAGDMTKTRSKEFIAGSPSRMKVQDTMGLAAEDEALAHKIMAGQRLARTPSLGAAGLNAELEDIGAKTEASRFARNNPALAYQIEALKTLGSMQTSGKNAQVDAESRVKAARLQAGLNEDGSKAVSPLSTTKPGRINLRALAAKKANPEAEVAPKPDDAESAGLLIKLLLQKFGADLNPSPER